MLLPNPGEPEPLAPNQRQVKVPQYLVSRVLGKMGATINDMQEQSKCEIKVNQDTKDQGFSIAIVSGTMAPGSDPDMAERLIREKIDERSDRLGGPGTEANPNEPRTTKEMKVEDHCVGKLIGKGGENIKSMTSEAGCNIQIKQVGGGAPADVTLGPGTEAQLATAERLIMAKCD